MTPSIESIDKLLAASKRIALVIHQRPDGDALGSGIAMAMFLEKCGHQVTLISPDTPPPFLGWMPGIERVLDFSQEPSRTHATDALTQADLIVCLDFPVLHRSADVAPLISTSSAPTIALDHHPDHDTFATIMWVDTKASATAVLVYRMIQKLQKQDLIDAQIATCLYLAIFTDTGAFQQPNTTAEAHLIVGDLANKGADLDGVRLHMSARQPLSRVRFFAHMLLHRLVVMPQYNAAYFKLTKADYLRFNLQSGDTAGLAAQALEIEGVSLSILMIEREEKIHLSMRSLNVIPVNKFAQDYFNGGGHRNASGGSCPLSLTDTEQRLRQMIQNEMPAYTASTP